MRKKIVDEMAFLSSHIILLITGCFLCGGIDLKIIGLFLIPILCILPHFFTKKLDHFPTWGVTLVCSLVFWFSDRFIQDRHIESLSLVPFTFLVLNSVFCVVAPKSTPNDFFGIRNGLTESSPIVWRKVHKLYSTFLCVFELPLILLIIYLPGELKLFFSVMCVLLPIVMAIIVGWFWARPMLTKLREQEKEDLMIQLKKEQGFRK